MSDEVIELKIQGPHIDPSGLKTLDAYIAKLKEFDALTKNTYRMRFEADPAGIQAIKKNMADVRATVAKAVEMPAASQKNSVYLSSLTSHLSRLSRTGNEFATAIARINAGFTTQQGKVEFLTGLESKLSSASKIKGSRSDILAHSDMQEAISDARRMIGLEMEQMFEMETKALESKAAKKLFQDPSERKGAAKGKSGYSALLDEIKALDPATEDLSASENTLTKAAGGSQAAISAQDQALLSKIKTLHTASAATDKLSTSEKKLSGSSREAAAGGAMVKNVYKDGKWMSSTFAQAPGITQQKRPGPEGESLTVTTDRMAELRSKTKAVNDEFAMLLRRKKSEGASSQEVSAIYQNQAKALDALSREYGGIEEASGRLVARQAEAARTQAAAVENTGRIKNALATEKKDRQSAAEFHKRIENDRWREVQRIEDEAMARIKSRSQSGAGGRALRREYETTAMELEKVARRFRNPDDQADVRRRASLLRNEGQLTEARKLAQQEAQYYKNAEKEKVAFARRLQRDASQALAADTLDDMKARGFKEAGRQTSRTSTGTREVISYDKENSGLKENVRLMIDRDAKGRLLNTTSMEGTKVFKQTGEATGYLTKNFLQNTLTVGVWAASVGALYGSMAILRAGMDAAVRYDRRFATLSVVFRGSAAEAAELRDEVLRLGVAYGQSGYEALEAATRFARLGLSKAQTLEAVRASLMAANVAEMPVNAAADQLAAVMATFNLQAKDLVGVINKLNAISNTYNVTNKDMLNGLGRVGAIARQAGLGLEETMGMIAAITARTGRSGSEAGNAIKAIVVALSNPKLQRGLADQFQFSVTDKTGELKNMSDIMRELYLRYNELTAAEQSHLIQLTAGKMQASRLTALIDGYVDSQVNAIRSLTNLDSAEQENARIKESLIVQVQSLATAYERLVYNLSQSGGNAAIVSTLRELVMFLRNVLTLMGTYNNVTAIAIGISALFAARLGVTAYRLGVASQQMTFASNTARAFQGAMVGLKNKFAIMNAELVLAGTRMRGFGAAARFAAQASYGLGTAVAFVGGALRAFLPLLLIFGAIELAMYAFNRVMDANASAWEKAQQKLAGYNDELERLKSLSEASRLSQRLVSTIITRLKQGGVKPEETDQYIKALSEMGGGGDEKKRASIERELRSSQQALGTMGLIVRATEILNGLKKEGVKISEAEASANRHYLEDARKAKAAAESEELAARGTSRHPDAQKNLQKAQQDYAGAANKAVRSSLDLNEDEYSEANRAEELRQQKAADKIQARLDAIMQGIQNAWNALSELGPVDRVKLNAAAIQEQINGLDAEAAAFKKNSQASRAAAEAAVKDAQMRYDAFTEYQKVLRNIEDAKGLIKGLQGTETGQMQERLAGMDKFNRTTTLDNAPDYREEIAKYEASLAKAISTLEKLKEKRDALEQGNPHILGSREETQTALSAAESNVTRIQNETQALNEQIAKQKEQLETRRQALAIEEQYARRVEAIEKGRKYGQMATLPLQYGNETERILRERRVLTSKMPQRDDATGKPMNMQAAWNDFSSASRTGDEMAQLEARETMQQIAVRLQQQHNDLVSRNLTLQAAITAEKIKQGKEASRNLLMTDREGQLRAAMAKKLQGDKSFNAEDFMLFSQETKQGISQTNPDLLPKEYGTELQELRREQGLATDALKGFKDGLEITNQAMLDVANQILSSNKQASGGTGGVDSKDAVALIQQGGSAAVVAINQMAQATYQQFLALKTATDENTRRINSIGAGDSAAKAQASTT